MDITQVAITLDYRYPAGAGVPIDAGKLVTDNGKVGDIATVSPAVAHWCLYDPHMQVGKVAAGCAESRAQLIAEL